MIYTGLLGLFLIGMRNIDEEIKKNRGEGDIKFPICLTLDRSRLSLPTEASLPFGKQYHF